MLLTELIDQLQEIKDKHGNLYVFCGDTEAGWIHPEVTVQSYSHYLVCDCGRCVRDGDPIADGEKAVVL